MIDKWIVIAISVGYALLLFAIAWWGERRAKTGKSIVNNPYTYALSLAVYCTAWTYYGSVGRAAESGLDFLSIYIGPTLILPLWWIILRKLIRICKTQNITTIADFIAARYGKNVTLGSITTIFCVLGIIPYISLQLKALSNSFTILVNEEVTTSVLYAGTTFYNDPAFYIAISISLFAVLFGARHIYVSERHEGMVTAIAFESIIKLFAFLVVGVFVCFGIFNGFGDIFQQALMNESLAQLFTFSSSSNTSDWLWINILSMLAIILLPRQFQVAVVENANENHLNKAVWLFPLYLLIINLFVLPIALGGRLIFFDQLVDADTYVLTLPLEFNRADLALLAYIGGYSAATGMIIVSTTALSNMLSNNVIIPAILGMPALKKRLNNRISQISLYSRRLSIIFIIILSYLYFKGVGEYFPLSSIGLISFAAVAQLAPGLLGGIFWKTGNRKGATTGLILGFSIWFFTLVVPTVVASRLLPESIMTEGLFGISLLKPYELFGLQQLSPVPHGLFWSLFTNLSCYVMVSLFTTQSSKEHNQAEVFVDIFKYSYFFEKSIVWKGTAYVNDIKILLINILGKQRAETALESFSAKYRDHLEANREADAKLINFAEKQLAGAIGATAARIMISSVVKNEEEISLDEVFNILRETQQIVELNKELRKKSNALKRATEQLKNTNEKLKQLDKLKDEFISTVTHEMRTPITSIRAFSEILHDMPDLEEEEKRNFLETIIKETQRMDRLINQVLDLERFDSGQQKLNLEPLSINEVIEESTKAVQQIIREKTINLNISLQPNLPPVLGDRDRLIQVLLNLLSNAIKFCNPDKGVIKVSSYFIDDDIKVNVWDNGKGIEPESLDLIFDKFYQARNQTRKKPAGSGLGLAISKKIIEHHQGKIWVESSPESGTKFSILLPVVKAIKKETYEESTKTAENKGVSS